jgi:hypothetical protein
VRQNGLLSHPLSLKIVKRGGSGKGRQANGTSLPRKRIVARQRFSSARGRKPLPRAIGTWGAKRFGEDRVGRSFRERPGRL